MSPLQISPPPSAPPELALLWVADVDVADREDLGPGPRGHRYQVPILGGRFAGPGVGGTVRPGGADRQLWRADGIKELDALYEVQTDDGAVITVRNRVLIDEQVDGPRYARSVVQLSAPVGPYGWLNRRVFVGTLESLRPARQAVRVTVYQLA